jgi:hypothetical protein
VAVYTGFPDGVAYATIGQPSSVVNVSGSAALRTALASATAGQDIVLANGSYSGTFSMSGKNGTASSGIRIRAANRGSAVFDNTTRWTLTNCSHVTVDGLSFPFDVPEFDLFQFRGASSRCKIQQCLFGPTSQVSNTLAGQMVFVGDDCQHIYIEENTFRNKGTSGNAIRAYGNFTTQVPCKYVRIAHNLLTDIGPEVGNDKEPIRTGVSSMSKVNSFDVIERNVFVRCKCEPEVISVKTNRQRVSGNVLYQCAGGIVIRHGSDSICTDNYIIDKQNTTASAGLQSGGFRFYDRNHVVDYNYVEGTIGDGFQPAFLFDTGDTTSTLNGHWNLVNCTGRRNVLVGNATGIVIGDNYNTAPANCIITDNLIADAGNGQAVQQLIAPTASTLSNNLYSAVPAGLGLTQGVDTVWRKAGYGPRMTLLKATDVGVGGALNATDGTGAEIGTGGGTPGGGGPFTAQVFVSPTGLDSNDGLTVSTPKRTLSAALGIAVAGNTISAAPGTYSGNFITSKGGTAGNFITIRSETKYGAVISGTGDTTDEACISVNHQYIRIQDFTLTGTNSSGVRHGVYVNANNVEVIGCLIYNICQFLTEGTSWQGGAGIDFTGPNRSNILIENNVIHHIGLTTSTQQLVHGIYCGVHGSSFTIRGNLIYECEDFGIHPYDATESSGQILRNNTVTKCGRGILTTGTSFTVQNNLCYNNGSSNFDIRSTGNTVSNNISGGTGNVSGTGIISGVNPLFVDYANNDFHLQSTSPAINAGTSTGAPATDIDGTTRPQGAAVDVGCYEYGGTGGGPTEPEPPALGKPHEVLHIGSTTGWNHFDLGLGLDEHINYPQSSLGNSPPVGAPWFYSKYNAAGKAVVRFSAPLGGATTSQNTQYARSELREYELNGTTKAAWDPASGDHWIEGVYAVTGLTDTKPSVCVQQAHGASDDEIMVLTQLVSGTVRLNVRIGDTTIAAVLDTNVTLGDEFYLKTRLLNGTPMIYYSDDPEARPTTPVTLTGITPSGYFSGSAAGWYFKTGSYNNTNELTDPDEDENASVVHVEARELKHWHSETPLGGAWPTPAVYTNTATAPIVSAGADASLPLGNGFSRTASVNTGGSAITSQSWIIDSGPSGVGNTISTSATVNWSPSVDGVYVLSFRAANAIGTSNVDTVVVTVSPVGGGGGGTLPTFVSVGVSTDHTEGTAVAIAAPPGVLSGHFQIAVIQDAGQEDILAVPSNWFLFDTIDVESAAGDPGGPSSTFIYYNTTGDSATQTWTKSGTRGALAVRAAWKDYSAIGSHVVVSTPETNTPGVAPLNAGTSNALAIAVIGSDRINAGAGPFTAPSGWASRFAGTHVVGAENIEREGVAIADVTLTGQQEATGTFTASGLADNFAVFTIILEGTGTATTATVALTVTPSIALAGGTVQPRGLVSLTVVPTIAIARNILWAEIGEVVSAVYPSSTTFPSPSLFPSSGQIVKGWTVRPNITIQPLVEPQILLEARPTLTFQATSRYNVTVALEAGLRMLVWPNTIRKAILRTQFPYPPPVHPFRLIAQRILDGEIVDWELPVAEDFEYVQQLSGPTVMRGSFKPEIVAVQELALDGYAYYFHVEIDGLIRASAIFLPPMYQESSLTFQCEGVAAVPHYHIYGGQIRGIGLDPLSVVRNIWNYVLSQPASQIGVTVSNKTSTAKLGEESYTVQPAPRTLAAKAILDRLEANQDIGEDWTWRGAPQIVFDHNDALLDLFEGEGATDIGGWLEQYVNDHGPLEPNEVEAKPYELLWWNAVNCGEEIDKLSQQVPFDYVEIAQWNAARTDVLHSIDFGHPRVGQPRPNLLFDEENIIEVVPAQEEQDQYASTVIVIGAGEGQETIRGSATRQFGARIGKTKIITDKTITTQERANAVAQAELGTSLGGVFSISEIVVSASHSNARLGTYNIGDDILVAVDIPWLITTYRDWYRITSISYKPSGDRVRLGVSRSASFVYPVEVPPPSEAIYPEPPPLPPPPPVFVTSASATMLMSPTLSIFASTSKPGTVSLTVNPTINATYEDLNITLTAPYYSVIDADTLTKKQAWKSAGGTHVNVTAYWDRLQPSSGALNSTEVANLKQEFTDAVTAGLKVTFRFGTHYPPAWTRVPTFGAGTFNSPGSADQSDVTTAAGRVPSIDLYYRTWTQAITVSDLELVRSRKQMSLLTWEAFDGTGPTNAAYQYDDITSGTYDSYITTTATTLRDWGHPIYLRPFHEMNGNWYPWGTQDGHNGNTAAKHKAAWAHLRNIFTTVGATNVIWVWSPNVTYNGATPLADLYPGDAQVDVIAVDGYNWGDGTQYAQNTTTVWQTPSQVFDATFTALRAITTTRPYWIGETGCADLGGNKAQWITDLFSYVRGLGYVQTLVWFHHNKERDWRINSTSAAASAFQTALAASAPRFKNQHGTEWAPISNINGDNVVDVVYSATARTMVLDFMSRVWAALSTSERSLIETIHIGGGTFGELHYPPVGSTPHWWSYSAPAQTGTGLATGQVVCPVPGHVPGNGSPWTANDTAFANWHTQSLTNYMVWQIETVRSLGYLGACHVLHPSFGLRSNWTQVDFGWREQVAEGTNWNAQIAAYPPGVWPHSTWGDGIDPFTPPAVDSDKASWRKLLELAQLNNKTSLLSCENTGGDDLNAMNRMFGVDGSMTSGRFKGTVWLNYNSLVSTGSLDDLSGHIS